MTCIYFTTEISEIVYVLSYISIINDRLSIHTYLGVYML